MGVQQIITEARPPVGTGPSTSAVLIGLRELPPPLSVTVAVLLMGLAPLSLFALAVSIAWALLTSGESWGVIVLKLVPSFGTPFILAALAYRGVKRALHYGDYDQGLFLARLASRAAAVIGAFLVWYVLIEGEPAHPTMAVPFLALLIAWIPTLPLRSRAAQEWPPKVLLRQGPEVRSALEMDLFLEARPHACGQTLPPASRQLAPTQDATGAGWLVDAECPGCGERLRHVFRHRQEAAAPDPASALTLGAPGTHTSALGGGDLVYLAAALAVSPTTDFRTVPIEVLSEMRARSIVGAQVTEELLALVPEGHKSVPGWNRTGRPVPLVSDADWDKEFDRTTLQQRLTEDREVTGRIEGEPGGTQASTTESCAGKGLGR